VLHSETWEGKLKIAASWSPTNSNGGSSLISSSWDAQMCNFSVSPKSVWLIILLVLMGNVPLSREVVIRIFCDQNTELLICSSSAQAQTLTTDPGQESQHFERHCCVRKGRGSYCYQNVELPIFNKKTEIASNCSWLASGRRQQKVIYNEPSPGNWAAVQLPGLSCLSRRQQVSHRSEWLRDM